MENNNAKTGGSTGPSPSLLLTAPPTAPSGPPAHPSLPQRPAYNFAATADSIGFGAPPTAQSVQNAPTAAQALAGSNRDVVANRRAIRMANMSAAEMLKAELSGLAPVKPDLSLPPKPVSASVVELESSKNTLPPYTSSSELSQMNLDTSVDPDEVPGFGTTSISQPEAAPDVQMSGAMTIDHVHTEEDPDADGEPDPDSFPANGDAVEEVLVGVKRKFGEDEDVGESLVEDDDDTPADAGPLAMKVNPDGTVEQEDTVKYV